MPNRLDKLLSDTIAALQENITDLDPSEAAELIDAWRRNLDDAEFDGADEISGILVQLQSQLESDEPDGSVIAALLGDLSDTTQNLADAAEDEDAGRLQLLADLLGDAGDSLEG